MRLVFNFIRRVPPVAEFAGAILLLGAMWFFKEMAFLAVFTLWYALSAASDGLRLRMWTLLFLTAVLLAYAAVTLPAPPDYHPSIPA